MPLFGSKHHDHGDADNDNDNTTASGDRHNTGTLRKHQGGNQQTSGLGNDANTGPTNTSAPDQYAQHPTGERNERDAAYPRGGGATGQGQGGMQGDQYGQQPGGERYERDAPYPRGGGGGGESGIPPASDVSHGPGSGGGGHRFTGKMESALGSLVGSAALKEKGAQKEQEANTIKMQGRELAEAERLEAEALMRRERAVAHGAHPANATLGGPNAGRGQEERN